MFFNLGELSERVSIACKGVLDSVTDKLTLSFEREALERLGEGDVNDAPTLRQIKRKVGDYADGIATFVHAKVASFQRITTAGYHVRAPRCWKCGSCSECWSRRLTPSLTSASSM